MAKTSENPPSPRGACLYPLHASRGLPHRTPSLVSSPFRISVGDDYIPPKGWMHQCTSLFVGVWISLYPENDTKMNTLFSELGRRFVKSWRIDFLSASNPQDLLKLNFNGSSDSTKTTLCFLGIRPRDISISSTDTIETSTADEKNNKSIFFTVSYLINSCGLIEQKAIYVSKKLSLKTCSQPNSVLTLLRDYGFTDTHISNLVWRRPLLLLADPIRTLKPKFEFFNSIGLCGTELAYVLSTNPTLLNQSLENRIIPSIAFLKTIVHTDMNVVKVLKRAKWILTSDPEKHLAPKIALLQAHGVSNSNISSLLTNHSRTFVQISVDRFDEIVKQVKEMGFDPSKCTFVLGIRGLSISKSLLEEKIDVYRRWGWSEEEIREAFLKQPNCMVCSGKKINQIMDFLVNKMGYDVSLVAKNPNVLLLSLENRIIPRCSVIQMLMAKGLVKKDHAISTMFQLPDKYFLEKFVTDFENKVPEVLNAYLGNVDVLELPG